MPELKLSIPGEHNIANALAVVEMLKAAGLESAPVLKSLCGFRGVEHRLEFVAEIDGVRYINDSKATNVNSTWYALETVEAPIIWIAGGVDKGNDYSIFLDSVKSKVKAIICLGADNTKIHKDFGGLVPKIVNTQSMTEAVRTAYYLGQKGDYVLLSPACASFDLFENYEDRGQQFKGAVREL